MSQTDDEQIESFRGVPFGFLRMVSNLSAAVALFLVLLAGHTDLFFPWTVEHRLTAYLLAVSFVAAAVLLRRSAADESWAQARLAGIAMTALFTALTYATWQERTQLDADFHSAFLRELSSPLWLPVCAVGAVASVGFLLVVSVLAVREPEPSAKVMPILARLLVLAHGLAVGSLGMQLILDPGAHAHWVPWQTNPLDARTIGAWLIAFAVAELAAAGDGDLVRLRPAMLAEVVLALGSLAVVALMSVVDSGLRFQHSTLVFALVAASALIVGAAGFALDALLVPMLVHRDPVAG